MIILGFEFFSHLYQCQWNCSIHRYAKQAMAQKFNCTWRPSGSMAVPTLTQGTIVVQEEEMRRELEEEVDLGVDGHGSDQSFASDYGPLVGEDEGEESE